MLERFGNWYFGDWPTRWLWWKFFALQCVGMAITVLLVGGCLMLVSGCQTCGEYRISALGSNIILGPGKGECVTFDINKGLLDVFIRRLKPKPPEEEPVTDANDPQSMPVTPTGSMAVPNPQ